MAASGQADFRARTTLLEQVHLIHQALPELAVADIDLSTELCGHRLAAPLVVTGMTGGTPEAAAINRDLARAAQEVGIAFGVGSQRAMLVDPSQRSTFEVRDVAPDVMLLGNLGAVQARELGPDGVAELARSIGASALAIHLNPAQELIQEGGDRDFTGIAQALGELRRALPIPLLVKETGCGLSSEAASAIAGAGIDTVDVSGAGGTSWVAVEARRAADESASRSLGEELWDWGLPTAVSVVACVKQDLTVIASGGMRSGLDVARALALGARAGGMAAPVLRAHQSGGKEGAVAFLGEVIRSIATVSLLCGCDKASDLARAPRHLGDGLARWLDDLGLR